MSKTKLSRTLNAITCSFMIIKYVSSGSVVCNAFLTIFVLIFELLFMATKATRVRTSKCEDLWEIFSRLKRALDYAAKRPAYEEKQMAVFS